MNLPTKIFTGMQYRETRKKPKGRRFTIDEKILSLSFYKRSPKSYKLLSKCFTLPSAKSLKKLLANIKIMPGINKLIFAKIHDSVASMSEDDKLCVLIFDEMSITPQIQYDAGNDKLKGFATLKTSDQLQVADHVLLFMVRGVKKNYKQPVAYYFTQNLNKIELKNVIKDVIRKVFATGLKILATVCDQCTTNVGAIESLITESKEMFLRKGKIWRNDFIVFNNEKIVPLYDVPHLLKRLRNNLLTKDLVYLDPEEGKQKVLKWDYFQQLYEADKSYGHLKILQKVTEEHINREKINKMKVKTAAQVFSHSFAIAAQHLYDSGKVGSEIMNIKPFVLMMDQLFDSLKKMTYLSKYL
ncbi:hypothetical protein HF086_000014 [Spodoptera exigua]|uniref:Transposable element P transposase n=1 Tax=Spodoptera exigua TaxID=7107 RepID=A0A922MZ79_SPOEX|nr:hypothetical protein HF086_000014 [Spodoptera exigua]